MLDMPAVATPLYIADAPTPWHLPARRSIEVAQQNEMLSHLYMRFSRCACGRQLSVSSLLASGQFTSSSQGVASGAITRLFLMQDHLTQQINILQLWIEECYKF